MAWLQSFLGIDQDLLIKIGLGIGVGITLLVALIWIAEYALDMQTEGNVAGCLVRAFFVGILLAATFIIVLGYTSGFFEMQ